MMKAYVASMLVAMLVCAASVTLFPDNVRLRFMSTRGDARKSSWVYDYLRSDAKLDVAFFGASFVWQSIDPRLIERRLGNDVDVANLAMPYVGRDLDYVLVREALDRKTPAVIVLQLRVQERRTAHPLFCELARKDDYLGQDPLRALMTLPQAGCFLRRQVNIAYHALTRVQEPTSVASQYATTKGFKSLGVVMDPTMSADVVRPILPEYLDWLEFHYSRHYLHKIVELANQRGVRIVFLYLPDFRDHRTPACLKDACGAAEVITLPHNLIDDPKLRSDASHFNAAGAREISILVADHLTATLQAGNRTRSSSTAR